MNVNVWLSSAEEISDTFEPENALFLLDDMTWEEAEPLILIAIRRGHRCIIEDARQQC